MASFENSLFFRAGIHTVWHAVVRIRLPQIECFRIKRSVFVVLCYVIICSHESTVKHVVMCRSCSLPVAMSQQ